MRLLRWLWRLARPEVMTAVEFAYLTGRSPGQDDLDRVNCPDAGAFGHWHCGRCTCGLPRMCCPDECDRPRARHRRVALRRMVS